MIDIGSPMNLNALSLKAKDTFKQDPVAPSDISTSTRGQVSKTSEKSSTRNEFDKTLDSVRNDKDQVVAPQKPAEYSDIKSIDKTEKESGLQEVNDPQPQERKVTRQAAMEIFLNRMQSELGIEPESLIEAFAQLTDEQLAASPEVSAQAVITQLGLDEKKSLKALDLYNQMLAMTAMAGMSQYLQNNNQEAQLHVMDKKESQLQQLRHSIDDMSDRFFVTGAHAHMRAGIDQQAKMADAYQAQLAMANMNSEKPQDSTSAEMIPTVAAAQSAQTSAAIDVSSMTPVAEGSVSSLNIPTATDLPVDNTVESVELEEATPSAPDSSPNIFEKLKAQSVQPDVQTVQAQAPNVTAPELKAHTSGVEYASAKGTEVAPATTAVTAQKASEGSDNLDSGDGSSQYDAQNLSAQPGSQAHTIQKGQSPFIMGAPQATTADIQNNVKEVISNAQFLAQKGGGEMKISLNPEGMGEVNLKVKMNDGNVSVEMITSSNEAKKVLEKGLGELKDSLATHKLHLDSIKIDNMKDTSNQMDQRHQDAERGFQQRFLGDFQQQNGNFRREMFEFASPEVPTSQTRDRAANDKYNPSAKRKTESTRRLDLVA